MARKSKEQWLALFKQHDDSGLNASEFCRVKQLCNRYFSKRKEELDWPSAKDVDEETSPRLVKVSRATTVDTNQHESMLLVTNNIRLNIPLSQSPTWVAELVKAISA
jgi:hypothetical protein